MPKKKGRRYSDNGAAGTLIGIGTVSLKTSTGRGAEGAVPFVSGPLSFFSVSFSLMIGTITPHSQLRQFIFSCFVLGSLTIRPLDHVSFVFSSTGV